MNSRLAAIDGVGGSVGDMVHFSYRHIASLVKSPIHDIIMHVGVGKRERLSVLVISYFITIW